MTPSDEFTKEPYSSVEPIQAESEFSEILNLSNVPTGNEGDSGKTIENFKQKCSKFDEIDVTKVLKYFTDVYTRSKQFFELGNHYRSELAKWCYVLK